MKSLLKRFERFLGGKMVKRPQSFEQFVRNFREEAVERAKTENIFQVESLTRLFIEYLTDEGELNDGEVCFYKDRTREVCGYQWGEELETLDLFVTIDADDDLEVALHGPDVTATLDRLKNFYFDSAEKRLRSIEESNPAYELVKLIEERKGKFKRLRLFLFTDGFLKSAAEDKIKLGAVPATIHFWDAERVWQTFGKGGAREPIVIDAEKDFGAQPIPCITTPSKGAEYDAYLAIIPGELLYKIYEKYGDRLLEKNVRSFLQVSGRINKGIQETIKTQPNRFLAYNNGISATAARVELAKLPTGETAIKSLTDFQIVNGGQTTASIFHAHQNQGQDVSGVFVQAKITVVKDAAKIDELVPWISRYANSQNRVNDADFYANDPLHVKVEEFSRSIATPPNQETGKTTYWFFERARGQYLDYKNGESDLMKRKLFSESNPTKQKFSKTDMAKFINSWNCQPHIVSLGAEKNFKKFSLEIAENGLGEFSEDWYRDLIAKAILFRATEKIVESQKFGGYRANTVTYTIAWLSHSVPGRVNFAQIWKDQKVDPSLEEVISQVCRAIRPVITNGPGGANVTEWCKKEECWEAVREVEVELPAAPAGVVDRPIGPEFNSASISDVANGLKAIVELEGPAPGHFVMRRYAEKQGIRRMTKGVSERIIKGLKRAVSEGLLEQENQLQTRGLDNYVFRIPGQEDQSVPRKDRSLNEIAPSEIALAMRARSDNATGDEVNKLLRAVLKDLGVERIRATHEQFVSAVERIYRESTEGSATKTGL